MNYEEIIRLDREHVWHPCTQEKDHERLPPIAIERGEGSYLVTARGERIIDAVSSWWVNLFGHNHPRLNRALLEQSQRIAHHIFAGFTHEPAVKLAHRLCERAPGKLNRVFFADNGSAAVEVALKMSFQYWQQSGKPGKTRFVSLTEAYHGETLGALAVSGCELYRKTYQPILMQGFSVQGPDCYRCPYGLHRDQCDAPCFEHMERTLAAHHREIAAVIIEPLIQAAAGMRIHPPIYLKKLRALCDHYQVHYIADEIAVGFGRTGRFFANEHAGTAPDILCLSKGITGGYLPLSVALTTDEIYHGFYDDYTTLKAFLHSHSYTGNPLACALAVEVMNIFDEEDILGGLEPRMDMLEAARARFEAHPHVGEMRRCGLVAAIEMVESKEEKRGYPWQQRRGYRFYQEALKRGALLRPLGNVIYFMPPLNIPQDVLARVLDIAWDCLEDITRES
ncbi:adenosylmethionine--8-amino-7-oxononanoate transaminase [Geoalkalibacter sp.]|uniref:adenosylmethionine--8-amino-7-oxononanoate transaminase n=1 Tax=Geoalkalibacter sp. TaxID=3041440 RepID=UPI00272E21AC|nr:adenosylmethionine--8-amino-7-oxononanoate transaminase [Geoalkalibacter sp.]